jgi:hypothetical protein
MAVYLDVCVLGTTSRTVHLQTGSQEVRGFESLRLHPKVLVDDSLSGPFTCRGRPPAAKLAAKPIDTIDIDRPVITLAAKGTLGRR